MLSDSVESIKNQLKEIVEEAERKYGIDFCFIGLDVPFPYYDVVELVGKTFMGHPFHPITRGGINGSNRVLIYDKAGNELNTFYKMDFYKLDFKD